MLTDTEMKGYEMAEETKFTVDADALRQVLVALNGPDYFIRELQATRNLPGSPIQLLTDQFNVQAAAPAQDTRTIPYAIALTAIERLRGCAATTIEDHEKECYTLNDQVMPQQVAFALAKEIHRIDAKAFLDEALQDAA